MLVNILSTEIKERAIILTVKTVDFLARMDKKALGIGLSNINKISLVNVIEADDE